MLASAGCLNTRLNLNKIFSCFEVACKTAITSLNVPVRHHHYVYYFLLFGAYADVPGVSLLLTTMLIFYKLFSRCMIRDINITHTNTGKKGYHLPYR